MVGVLWAWLQEKDLSVYCLVRKSLKVSLKEELLCLCVVKIMCEYIKLVIMQHLARYFRKE